MNSHDLATELLKHENLPVSLVALGHTYSSLNHSGSHGHLKLCIGKNNYGIEHIFIGHMMYDMIEDGKVKEVFLDK